MLLVGVTGGLASGKTTVAGLFQECGAFVIQADQLARTVVTPGKTAWKEIVKTFGIPRAASRPHTGSSHLGQTGLS